jgi:hypothetical protein
MTDTSVSIRNRDLKVIFDKFSEGSLVFNISNLKGDLDPKGYTINKVADYVTIVLKKLLKEKWDSLVFETKESDPSKSKFNDDVSNVLYETNRSKDGEVYVPVTDRNWNIKNFMNDDTPKSAISKDAKHSMPLKNSNAKPKARPVAQELKSRSVQQQRRSETPEKKVPGYMKSSGVRLEKQIRSNIVNRSRSPSRENNKKKEQNNKKVNLVGDRKREQTAKAANTTSKSFKKFLRNLRRKDSSKSK